MVVSLLLYLVFFLSTVCTGLGVLFATVYALAPISRGHMLVLNEADYRGGWLLPFMSLFGLTLLVLSWFGRDFGVLDYIFVIWTLGGFMFAGMISPFLKYGAPSEQ